MEAFAFNPKLGTETIEAFNVRVGTFCNDNPVVLVNPSVVGGTLVLSLTEAADVDIAPDDEQDCLSASVLLIPPESLPNVETILDAEKQRLLALDTEENVCIPTCVTVHPLGDGAVAVFQFRAGIVETGSAP
jgi:hypothetical protein